jgi:hypothetical protein
MLFESCSISSSQTTENGLSMKTSLSYLALFGGRYTYEDEKFLQPSKLVIISEVIIKQIALFIT